MSRRIKLTTLAIFCIMLAIGIGRVVLAARLTDPLQFRLVSAPVWVDSDAFGDADGTPFEIEVRNTSSIPIRIYNIGLTNTSGVDPSGWFVAVDLPERDTGGYPQYYGLVIGAHDTVQFIYKANVNPTFHRDATSCPVVNYVWISCTLDRIDGWLQKCTPKAWASHLPLIEPVATQTPLEGMGPQSIPSPR